MVYFPYTMSNPKAETLTLQRIRTATREKLLRVARIDDRSPVAVLDRLLDEALRDRGVEVETTDDDNGNLKNGNDRTDRDNRSSSPNATT